MKRSQEEEIEVLKYKMDDEGFDYCFRDYSDFLAVEDEKFHELRKAFVKAADELEEYIEQM